MRVVRRAGRFIQVTALAQEGQVAAVPVSGPAPLTGVLPATAGSRAPPTR
ncbi:hypothetical protein Areg01_55640 [Actinoplanes regularis]|nr:hypothetical protein Areg01_55640 [Actinoplanes regularis]